MSRAYCSCWSISAWWRSVHVRSSATARCACLISCALSSRPCRFGEEPIAATFSIKAIVTERVRISGPTSSGALDARW